MAFSEGYILRIKLNDENVSSMLAEAMLSQFLLHLTTEQVLTFTQAWSAKQQTFQTVAKALIAHKVFDPNARSHVFVLHALATAL